MPLVAGIDSSTQSCKVIIRDSVTGALVRQGRASHPDGTEVHPDHWWTALQEAMTDAGGLDDVDAVSIGGQQHGMVCLDESGNVVRPALLWNDTRSAPDAEELILEAGGGDAAAGGLYWASTTGTVPVASLTATKLRWLARNEPGNARLTAAVCLPHDWLSWRLAGHGPGTGPASLELLRTDRSDASGTGYFSAGTGEYLPQVLERTLGHVPVLPTVVGPLEAAGKTPAGALIGPGAGDNAAAGLGVSAAVGDVVISIGTSGTVFAVSDVPAQDASGLVAGFADATGNYLPLACTLNATRIFDATASLLGVSLTELSDLALSAPEGADGLTLVPYFEGERTPNLPDATGSLHGITVSNYSPANLARAAVEGVLCSLADGLAALQAQGVLAQRVILVGGGAQSEAVQQIAVSAFGVPVFVPKPGEYVADGAARQAAGVLTGQLPDWKLEGLELTPQSASGVPAFLDRYRRYAAGVAKG
ncbi:xylulokinase [Arthrobacter sp. yr096]|uniref:xylulokinase n=1 Tax=unclassified Arthrobacter TaxID=235627 RepID=UPI000897F4F0|nr:MULTISPECIES: FGGY-family carbohydrate kinase [unclassified Arthrobacter]SDW67594.1 xylulokinase [Arthrobacter sp. cf158]SEJ33133.1 xylulokinase [Arthrobacter sp. yr096]